MCIAVGQVISVPPFSCLKLPLERFFESKICEVALPLTVCLQSQLWDWNSMVGYRQNGYLVLQCDLEFHVNSYVIPCPQEVCMCSAGMFPFLKCIQSFAVFCKHLIPIFRWLFLRVQQQNRPRCWAIISSKQVKGVGVRWNKSSHPLPSFSYLE